MKNKLFYLYVFFALYSAASICVYADDADSSSDAHSSYLNDLNKLIASSSDNIKEVNDSIEQEAIFKRNQEREEKAREYYQKGVELAGEGKLDEARVDFEKAVQLTQHPEMADYSKENELRNKKQEEALKALEAESQKQQADQSKIAHDKNVDAAYKQAVELYEQNKYYPAQEAFERVDRMVPGYRATKSYLKIISQSIIMADTMATKQQVLEAENQQKEDEEARAKENEILRQENEEKEHEEEIKKLEEEKADQQKQEGLQKELAEERERAAELKANNDETEKMYSQALSLYRDHQFEEAKDGFLKVKDRDPNYKETQYYLGKVDDKIKQAQEKEQRQQELAQERQRAEELKEKNAETEKIYDQALSLYRSRQFDAAKDEFLKVKDRDADYRSTQYYLGKIDDKIKQAQADEQRQKDLAEQQQREQELKAKNDETEKMYSQALSLYRDHQFEGAKDGFLKVKDRDANYKSTQYYLGKIDDKIKEDQADAQHQKELAQEQQEAQALKDKADQIQGIYDQAVSLYNVHQLDDAKAQFEAVEHLSPDYKNTRRYLHKIEVLIAKAESDKRGVFVPFATVPTAVVTTPVETSPVQPAAPVEVIPQPAQPVVVPVPVITPPPAVQAPAPVAPASQPVENVSPLEVKPVLSLADQQKEDQDIAELAQKSAQLYHQIADISDDKYTGQTKRKMAEVDSILNNLKETKDRALRKIQEEENKRQREERKAEIEKMYQVAIEFIRTQDYAKAKIEFLEIENTLPDYRSTRRYLRRIEDYQKQAGIEAVTAHEQQEAQHLKQLQDKENTFEAQQAQQMQEKQDKILQEQQADLANLAQKASDINDDILRLSKAQDYDSMKVKFAELENTVSALKVLKDQMTEKKDDQEQEKQMLRESLDHRQMIVNQERQAVRQLNSDGNQEPKENRLFLSSQPSDSDLLKHREIMREQNALFNEGVDRFEHKKYTEAKLLFGELADQHDRRAEAWLKKVDRAITRELLTSQESEERERTAFIEDQLKAQRELIIIQERERQRQKKLTEELERQKRLYEDDRLLQLRKEETMKAQERERQRQEEKREQIEKEKEKQQEMLRFHKITIAVKPEARQMPVEPVVAPQPAVVPVDNTKILLSQKEQEHQAQIKADQDARQKRLEEQEKEREHQKELMDQREQERQAKLKADAEAREEREKAQAEKIVQEQKRKEELLRQQEEQREEKIKQEQIIRDETKRREEFEQQERQRQAQLENQREIVRKQLEDGVESLYQEALGLYKQGDYSDAADRFKDIQDIIPGYKRSEQYMDEARQRSLSVKSQVVVSSDASTTPVSHQDNVSKALDLFDPNAK